MSVLAHRLRRGAYCDSIVLLGLQRSLAARPGVLDAGAVMATEHNLAVLATSGLSVPQLDDLAPDDLLVVVRAESPSAAEEALDEIDALLSRRRASEDAEYRPKSLGAAVRLLPEANWALVSVPGRHAPRVAREALRLGRHVFLFSDNVPLAEEDQLKRDAAARGLLVLGPDCGTAIVGGVGFGFANRVPRGTVGLVAASGTGLQAVSAGLAALGCGVSHALGTGGRDLSAEIGGATALAALDLLARDDGTDVLVVISKPPSPEVSARVIAAAQATGKPVIVHFQGMATPLSRIGNVSFTASLRETAMLAARLATTPELGDSARTRSETSARFLRGCFCGGTLAQEALLCLRPFATPLFTNLHGELGLTLGDPHRSEGHCVVDLGDDALTVGRPHPMLDPTLLAERIELEAGDGSTGAIVFDLVLGDGAPADPAALLEPALAEARRRRPELFFAAVLVGTEDDPQPRSGQAARLEALGVEIFEDVPNAIAAAWARLTSPPHAKEAPPVPLSALATPVVLNIGLEAFAESLRAQGTSVLSLDWKPPAGGNERMMALLDRLR